MTPWRFERKPSVAELRKKAAREAERLRKRGEKLSPVVVDGRVIAGSFWGKAWCSNLESYRDFENRLPRGRSYVRHGAVVNLEISAGKIVAVVSGKDLYNVTIKIMPLGQEHWSRLKTQCSGQIASLIELLEGRLSDRVMQIVTHREQGLFPKPVEIDMECSCPDWATMCKHVAAVMYGVGARLDQHPELLFTLRGLNHSELLSPATPVEVSRGKSKRKTLAQDELASVFGIDLDVRPTLDSPHSEPLPKPGVAHGTRRRRKPRSP